MPEKQWAIVDFEFDHLLQNDQDGKTMFFASSEQAQAEIEKEMNSRGRTNEFFLAIPVHEDIVAMYQAGWEAGEY